MDAQCVVVSSSMGCEGHWWGGLPRELQGLIQICPAARVGHRSGPRIWEINVVADIVCMFLSQGPGKEMKAKTHFQCIVFYM